MTFVYSNIAGAQNIFSQFTYYSFDLPDIAGPISQLVVGAGFFLVRLQSLLRQLPENGTACRA